MKRYEKGYSSVPMQILALPVICLLIGIVLISIGIWDLASDQTKGYEKTTGRLVDYTLYEAGGYDAARKTQTADTYRLIYSYTVDDEPYTLSTDYGTSIVPSFGSEAEILYNPENPDEAVIGGPNRFGRQMIFFGLFFALGSVPLFLPFLPQKTEKKKKRKQSAGDRKKHEFDWLAVGLGFLFLFFPYGAMAIISNSYSPIDMARYFVNNFHVALLILVIMSLAGAAAVIRSLFFGKIKPKSQDERQNRRK